MTSSSVDTTTIELNEHDQSAPLELSEHVLDTIDTRINDSTTRLNYEYTKDGSVRLKTSSYVGLVSLPNGMQVRIRPKAAGGNFLRLLLYAHGSTAATIDSTVKALEGELFFRCNRISLFESATGGHPAGISKRVPDERGARRVPSRSP